MIWQLKIQNYFFLSLSLLLFCGLRKWQFWLFHSFGPLIIVGQSPASLGHTGSVTDFSQQDVCHADLFISLTVLVYYHRNELNRLHRGVYEAAHTIHTLLRNWQDRNVNIKSQTVGSVAFWNSICVVAVDSWLGIKNRSC